MLGKQSRSDKGFSCNLEDFKTAFDKTITNTLFGPVLHWLGDEVNYLEGLCHPKSLIMGKCTHIWVCFTDF